MPVLVLHPLRGDGSVGQRRSPGDHVAAWQEPDLFTTEVREAFRSLR